MLNAVGHPLRRLVRGVGQDEIGREQETPAVFVDQPAQLSALPDPERTREQKFILAEAGVGDDIGKSLEKKTQPIRRARRQRKMRDDKFQIAEPVKYAQQFAPIIADAAIDVQANRQTQFRQV